VLKVVVTAADELLTDQGPLVPVDVLLVEDDPGDVLMTRETFEQRGMRNRLHVVSDGEQAIEFLRRAGDFSAAPTPGLILLDLNLPRRNGLDVLDEVKSDSELRRIPVVVLTTSHAEQDIVRSYSLHANAYVTKPIDFDRFMTTIGQIDDFYLTLVKLPGGMTGGPSSSMTN
jgi:CheY-like chemotaxis protein